MLSGGAGGDLVGSDDGATKRGLAEGWGGRGAGHGAGEEEESGRREVSGRRGARKEKLEAECIYAYPNSYVKPSTASVP